MDADDVDEDATYHGIVVQDSPDDKAIQIGVMEMIYGGAFVTFFAVGGHDARAGLPGFRAQTRGKHQTIEVVKDLHLAVPLPDLKEVLTKSVWGTRGYRLDKTAFRYGMPLRDLDNAMLWSPVDSAGLVRRAIPAESPWLASVLRGQRRDHEKTQGDDDAKVGRCGKRRPSEKREPRAVHCMATLASRV
ncbi:hypothetical protein AB1N83_013031 [Pleurotus pulmonarius]